MLFFSAGYKYKQMTAMDSKNVIADNEGNGDVPFINFREGFIQNLSFNLICQSFLKHSEH